MFQHAKLAERKMLVYLVIRAKFNSVNAMVQRYYQALMMAQMKGGMIYRLLLKYQKEN